MNDISKATAISEVGWRLHREVTPEAYNRDLAYAHEQALSVCEWVGEDRDGQPMAITWIATDNGRVLAAYEISGRA